MGFLRNPTDPAIKSNGIDVDPGPGKIVKSLTDLLTIAGVATFP